MLVKFVFDDFSINNSSYKIINTFIFILLTYSYIKSTSLSIKFIFNILLFSIVITNLIAIFHYSYFPGITIIYDSLGVAESFIYIDGFNNYYRDGLFGANILSYINFLFYFFILFNFKNRVTNIYFIILYLFIYSIIIAILESRLVIIFTIITTLYRFRKFIIYYILLLFPFIFIFYRNIFTNLQETRFVENIGRSEKISLYLSVITSNFKIFFLGQSQKDSDIFNNKNFISLSDNSFLEVFVNCGLFFSILFFLIFFSLLFGLNNYFRSHSFLLFLFILSGFFLTTSIYFLNYLYFLFFISSLISYTVNSKNNHEF